MAYQAMRTKRVTEDFELTDADGSVKYVLHVNLDADDMLPKVNKKYIELTRVLAETTEMKRKANSNEEFDQAYDLLGRATVALYEAVFGSEDTKTIVEFYESRYIEMCREVTPFITGVVIPRCIEIKNENRKSILENYNKKQKTSLLKR